MEYTLFFFAVADFTFYKPYDVLCVIFAYHWFNRVTDKMFITLSPQRKRVITGEKKKWTVV